MKNPRYDDEYSKAKVSKPYNTLFVVVFKDNGDILSMESLHSRGLCGLFSSIKMPKQIFDKLGLAEAARRNFHLRIEELTEVATICTSNGKIAPAKTARLLKPINAEELYLP